MLDRVKDHDPKAFGDLHSCLLVVSRTTRQENSKDINNINNTINQFALIDIYRLFYPTIEYTFTKLDHILEYKTSDNKFKMICYKKYLLRTQWN